MKSEIAQFSLFLKRRFGNRSTSKHYIHDLELFLVQIGDKPSALISAFDVSPHILRHTLATLLINQGMPIETLQKLLGHRSLSVTQRYVRLNDSVVQQQFQKAIENIEGIAASAWPLPYSIINVQTGCLLT